MCVCILILYVRVFAYMYVFVLCVCNSHWGSKRKWLTQDWSEAIASCRVGPWNETGSWARALSSLNCWASLWEILLHLGFTILSPHVLKEGPYLIKVVASPNIIIVPQTLWKIFSLTRSLTSDSGSLISFCWSSVCRWQSHTGPDWLDDLEWSYFRLWVFSPPSTLRSGGGVGD